MASSGDESAAGGDAGVSPPAPTPERLKTLRGAEAVAAVGRVAEALRSGDGHADYAAAAALPLACLPALATGDPAVGAAVLALVEAGAIAAPTAEGRATFSRALAGALIKAEKAFPKARPYQCLCAAQWCRVVLGSDGLGDLGGAAKRGGEALSRVACGLLDLAAAGGLGSAALDAADTLIAADVGALLAEGDDVGEGGVGAGSSSTPATTTTTARDVVVAHVASAPTSDEGKKTGGCGVLIVGAALGDLDAFVNAGLVAKGGRPHPSPLYPFGPRLVATLSRNDLETTILPAAARAALRSPEAALPALAVLVRWMTDSDLALRLWTEVVASSVAAALPHERDEVRRADAASCVAAALCRTTGDDPALAAELRRAALTPILDRVGGEPGGAKPKPLSSAERSGLMGALTQAAAAARTANAASSLLVVDADLSALARDVVDRLGSAAAAVEGASADATRAGILSAAAAWAPLLTSDADPPAGAVAAVGAAAALSHATSPLSRRAGLGLAVELTWNRGPAATAGLVPIVPALVAAAKEGADKPASAGDGAAALLSLLAIDPATAAPFLDAVDPALLRPSLVSRLAPDQVSTGARLALASARRRGVGSRGNDSAWPEAPLLARCVLREVEADAAEASTVGASSVSAAAVGLAAEAARDFLALGGGADAALASALLDLGLGRTDEDAGIDHAVAAEAEAPPAPLLKRPAAAAALAAALPAEGPRQAGRRPWPATASCLADLLLLRACVESDNERGGDALLARFPVFPLRNDVIELLESLSGGAADRLLAVAVAAAKADPFGAVAGLGGACARALAALAAAARGSAWPRVRDALADLLDRSAHDALTPMDCVTWSMSDAGLPLSTADAVRWTIDDRGLAHAAAPLATETDDGRALVLADRGALTLSDEDEAVARAAAHEAAMACARELQKAAKAATRSAPAGGHVRAATAGGGAASAAALAGKPDAQLEGRLRQAAREALARRGAAAVEARLAVGCALTTEACRRAPESALLDLARLGDLVAPLLASRLRGAEAAALQALRGLFSALPAPLGNDPAVVARLAGAVHLVVRSGGGGGEEASAGAGKNTDTSVVECDAAVAADRDDRLLASADAATALEALRSACVDGCLLLPPPALALCCHVLGAAVAVGRPAKTFQGPAMAVLARHAELLSDGEGTPGLPRARLLRALWRYVGAVPAARAAATDLARAIGRGCRTEASVGALLEGCSEPSRLVRAVALAALSGAPPAAPPGSAPLGPGAPAAHAAALWCAAHDSAAPNAAAAKNILTQASVAFNLGDASHRGALLGGRWLASPHREAREAAARALAAAAAGDGPAPDADVVAQALADALRLGSSAPAHAATVAARSGAGLAISALAPLMSAADVDAALGFLLGDTSHGGRSCAALGDSDNEARTDLQTAAERVCDAHGSRATALLPSVEAALEEEEGEGVDATFLDRVREGAIVALGTLARRLDASSGDGHAKAREVASVLLEALDTPSEPVQRSCGRCLGGLVRTLHDAPAALGGADWAAEAIADLLATVTQSEDYARRRGAAYGLAGVIKGLGTVALKRYGVMDRLRAAGEAKKDPVGREGALFALAALTETSGRLFEPWVVHVLPLLLTCLGDGARGVQAAAQEASKAVMGQLTAPGVRLVLPSLLTSLDDPAWRTKQGAVGLLASMAYLGTRQLAAALPTVVPRLGEALADPHPKVQEAARGALEQVGGTVLNPEVRALAPALLDAVANRAAGPGPALDAVLATTFVNTVDAASLALLVPPLLRGLRAPDGATKRKAARILGRLCEVLHDAGDLVPYLPLAVPSLQAAVLDAGPEVRAVAARTLGSLLRGLGEERFSEAVPGGGLVPWLMTRLRSETSAVDRHGAAQGLAEVLAVLGPERLREALPDICAAALPPAPPHVREGHMTLVRYLPMALSRADFAPFLEQTLACLLPGLADELDGVRDAALRGGRTLVDLFAGSALTTLLPSVEASCFAADSRVRQASVELLGNLLHTAVGSDRKFGGEGAEAFEDGEGGRATSQGPAVRKLLGDDGFRSVLARLFVVRAGDPQLSTRSAALAVWKALVDNTPRALGEILGDVIDLCVSNLASPLEDRRAMCSRAMGELVRKLGDRVVRAAVPVLRDASMSPEASVRLGACVGLSEVLESMTRHQLAENLAELLPCVQTALVDNDEGVREAAGAALGSMFRGGGGGVVEQVVPGLLRGLEGDISEHRQAMEGLGVILSVRPQSFRDIAPRLAIEPLEATRVEALAELAQLAGDAALPQVSRLLPTLLRRASRPDALETDTADRDACQSAANALVALGEGEAAPAAHAEAVRTLVSLMASGRVAAKAGMVKRAATAAATGTGADGMGDDATLGACRAAAYFCRVARNVDLVGLSSDLLGPLVDLLAEPETLGNGTDKDEVPNPVPAAALAALSALSMGVSKERLPELVASAAAAVKAASSRRASGRVPGLCLPKGLAPLVAVHTQGLLLGGSVDLRRLAAEGLGGLVSAADEVALKPHVLQITGPLIRVLGDRSPPDLKVAILKTLGLLLGRGGAGLKPFVPQLQTSFVKCLGLAEADDSATRRAAAANLGDLAGLSARADQLGLELLKNASTLTDAALAAGHARALRGALTSAGDRLKPETLAQVRSGLDALAQKHRGQADPEAAPLRAAIAGCVGALAGHLRADDAEATSWLSGHLPSDATGLDTARAHFSSLVLCAVAEFAPEGRAEVLLDGHAGAAARATGLARAGGSDARAVLGRAMAGIVAAFSAVAAAELLARFAPALVVLLSPDQDAEVRVGGLRAIRRAVGRAGPGKAAAAGALEDVVPPVAGCCVGLTGLDRVYAERTLGILLDLGVRGPDLGTAARFASSPATGAGLRAQLTESYLSRLARLAEGIEPADEDRFEAIDGW